MHDVEVKRRMAEEDIDSIAVLLRAAEAADGHPPLGEHKWLDLVEGGRSGFAGFVARPVGQRRVVGYAQVSRGAGSWGLEYVVHPSLRANDDGIGRDLLGAAIAEIGRAGGGHVHLWVPQPSERHDADAVAVGLRRGRELLHLLVDLPLPGVDETLETRPFVVGRDEQTWLELNNAAFGGHPEQGGWSLETLRDREAQPWFDPAGFLLHEQAGRLAGFCWTKVHDDEPPLGEIYVIAVRPDLAGHGLGRRLLRAGLDFLAGRGLTRAGLYVDSDNVAARALYESFGFVTDHHDRAYVGDVAAT